MAGFFYLDQLQLDLMEAKLDSLSREATLLAAALGEGAVGTASTSEAGLDPTDAATLVHRLNLPVDTRALLFNADGTSRDRLLAAAHGAGSDDGVTASGGGPQCPRSGGERCL